MSQTSKNKKRMIFFPFLFRSFKSLAFPDSPDFETSLDVMSGRALHFSYTGFFIFLNLEFTFFSFKVKIVVGVILAVLWYFVNLLVSHGMK